MKVGIEIFADTADPERIRTLRASGDVAGFTTNPTLMRRAGVTSYREYAALALDAAGDLPISLEVLADDPEEMERQAHEICGWAPNVWVKIPVINTEGTPSVALAARLMKAGVRVNLTAVFTARQLTRHGIELLPEDTPFFVSVFAGRIADTGQPPENIISDCQKATRHLQAHYIWASTREIRNVFDARVSGCYAITMVPEMITRMQSTLGKDLCTYSRETVMQFRRDVLESGIRL